MTFRRSVTAAFCAIAAVSPASAQIAVCAADDARCISAQAVTNAVGQFNQSAGIREFIVGSVCGAPELVARGETAYASTLPQIISTATVASSNSLNGFPYGVVEPIQKSISATVQTVRSSYAAGIVAGLQSMFQMYPRSRAEYCARTIAAL